MGDVFETISEVVRRSVSAWSVETIGRDLLLNLFGGLVASVVVFVIARRWDLVLSYIRRDRAAFRNIFGWRTVEHGTLTVAVDTYLDTRVLYRHMDSRGIPKDLREPLVNHVETSRGIARFFKLFPTGHFTTIPGTNEFLLSYSTARGANYVTEGLRGLTGIAVSMVADREVAGRWDGAFVALGNSYTNIKTDDIKHLPENRWLENDEGPIRLKDGEVIATTDRADKGFLMKLDNPHFPGYALIICVGLGEWGTSGAAWFFATRWREFSRRFGRNPFLLAVEVTPGSDQSAREILMRGRETRRWRIRRRLRKLRGVPE